jgi:DNA-binding NtrC family response regulator
MNGPVLLVVDDHANTRAYLRTLLEHEGYQIRESATGEAALEFLRSNEGKSVRGVLLDLKLPNISGIDLIAPIKEKRPSLPIIIMTAHATVPTAVSAIQKGAFHYLEKPLSEEDLLGTLKAALSEDRGLVPTGPSAEEKPWAPMGPFMSRLKDRVLKAAHHSFPVLITGESGTGKELIARTIHTLSSHSGGPFLAVNTGAIPKELVNSELFGYEKGSFTGANERKAGWFESAGHGTLFLDEIGTMEPSTQIALLRVLETRSFTRVGGTAEVPFEARIICATNDDLSLLIREGRFREDLYYRLNVHSIRLPPLRERKEDILPLAGQFLAQALGRNETDVGFEPGARSVLERYPWPGNIRELKNVMISLAIEKGSDLSKEQPVMAEASWFPDFLRQGAGAEPQAPTEAPRTLREGEKEQIRKVLRETGGNKALASRILGISRKALYSKLREYGLKDELS